jgi:branched-chain amino acid transport system permease protein
LLGAFDFDLYGRTAYAYSVTTLFVLFLLARLIVRSPFGLSLMAIRRNPLRAAALGVPVHRRLIAAYTLGAAYAGAAGALLAQTTGYVSLDVLEFQRSADVLLTLIIGGTGWLYGGIAGAIVFKILQDLLSSTSPQFWMFWMGVFLVVLALVGRERLADGVRALVARVLGS